MDKERKVEREKITLTTLAGKWQSCHLDPGLSDSVLIVMTATRPSKILFPSLPSRQRRPMGDKSTREGGIAF